MMTLEGRTQQRRNGQGTQRAYRDPVDVAADRGRLRVVKQSVFTQVLQVTADDEGRSTAWRAKQVTWARIGTADARREFRVTGSGSPSRIATWRGARPDRNRGSVRVDGQRPLRVDAFNGRPRNVHGAENVSHRDFAFINVEPWQPKQGNASGREQRETPAIARKPDPIAGCNEARKASGRYRGDHNAQPPSESGSEARGSESHDHSFADSPLCLTFPTKGIQ